jgi:hypothetical protein
MLALVCFFIDLKTGEVNTISPIELNLIIKTLLKDTAQIYKNKKGFLFL